MAVFFALAACSEEVYQENDKQNEPLASISDASGGTKPFTSAPGYESPWDFSLPGNINYFLHSNLPSSGDIVIRVTPYIGLAYWDGIDNGSYDTPTGSYNLTSGMYPNLYNGGNEYGNYITANPIVLNVWSPNPQTEEIGIGFQGDHCPVFSAWTYTYNPHTIFFDVMNNDVVQPAAMVGGLAVPATPATFQEALLLNDYGKVMYYKVEFGHSSTPNVYTETKYVLALEVDDLNNGEWDNTFLTDTFGGELHFNILSQELVVDLESIPAANLQKSGHPFDLPTIPSYPYDVEIKTWYDGPYFTDFVWLWINKYP